MGQTIGGVEHVDNYQQNEDELHSSIIEGWVGKYKKKLANWSAITLKTMVENKLKRRNIIDQTSNSL